MIPYTVGENADFPIFEIGETMDEMGMTMAGADLFVGGLECPAEWYGLEPAVPQRCLVAVSQGTPMVIAGVRTYDGGAFQQTDELDKSLSLQPPSRLVVTAELPHELRAYQESKFSSMASDCHEFIGAIPGADFTTIVQLDFRSGSSVETVCLNEVVDVSLQNGGMVLVGVAGPVPVETCQTRQPDSSQYSAGVIGDDNTYALLTKNSRQLTVNSSTVGCSSDSSTILWAGPNDGVQTALTKRFLARAGQGGECTAISGVGQIFDIRRIDETTYAAAGEKALFIDSSNWLSELGSGSSWPTDAELCDQCGVSAPGAIAVTELLNDIAILVQSEPGVSEFLTSRSLRWSIDEVFETELEPFGSGQIATSADETVWIKPEWE